jgi:hypothetical protein
VEVRHVSSVAQRCVCFPAISRAAVLLAATAGIACGAQPLADASEEAGATESVDRAAVDPVPPPSAEDLIDDVFSSLGTVFEQTPGWAWLTLFAGILGGLIAGKIVQAVFRRVGERMRSQGRDARGIVFDSLAGSAYLVLMTLGIQFGLAGVRMTQDIGSLAQSVLVFLFALAVGWFVFRMVDLVDVVLARHIEKSKSKLAAQIAPLLRKAFRIFVIIIFNDFNADSLNISVSYWYFLDAGKGHDWWGYLDHAEAINHRLFEAFAAAGIEFAFPTQTLYLAGDASRELSVRVLSGAEGTAN